MNTDLRLSHNTPVSDRLGYAQQLVRDYLAVVGSCLGCSRHPVVLCLKLIPCVLGAIREQNPRRILRSVGFRTVSASKAEANVGSYSVSAPSRSLLCDGQSIDKGRARTKSLLAPAYDGAA